jgi:hypothetical protein
MEGRGFGFVTFSDPACADSFLSQREHVIDGKRIEAKSAVPKSEQGGYGGGGSGGRGQGGPTIPNKMFVGGTVS